MSEKSIEEVYEDRNLLALAFARAAWEAGWNAGYYPHDEWVVVFVDIPDYGQVSWHMRPGQIPDDWLPQRDAESVFDGHTREMKNRRLREYAEEGVEDSEDGEPPISGLPGGLSTSGPGFTRRRRD